MASVTTVMSSVRELRDFTVEHKEFKLEYTLLDQAETCVYTIVITYETTKGIIYEEEFKGNGRSLEEAKGNTASKALNRSSTLQSVRHGSCRRYERQGSQTGYVLVICFRSKRQGAEKDVERILSFMQDQLKYTCLVCYDPTTKDLQQILEQTAQHLRHNTRDYFCFTLFIMGHGNERGIRTKDSIISEKEIIYEFRNENLPQFVGKPKAFFIQCCRGGAHQEMVYQADFDDDDQLFVDFVAPADGDIYVANATTEGYAAFRNPNWGSVFIFHCIETFKRDYSNTHLEEMMIDVKANIALHSDLNKDQSIVKLPQMPITTTTLTKRFFF